jgi:hypothetical protein
VLCLRRVVIAGGRGVCGEGCVWEEGVVRWGGQEREEGVLGEGGGGCWETNKKGMADVELIKSKLRAIPDFPKAGIMFQGS